MPAANSIESQVRFENSASASRPPILSFAVGPKARNARKTSVRKTISRYSQPALRITSASAAAPSASNGFGANPATATSAATRQSEMRKTMVVLQATGGLERGRPANCHCARSEPGAARRATLVSHDRGGRASGSVPGPALCPAGNASPPFVAAVVRRPVAALAGSHAALRSETDAYPRTCCLLLNPVRLR